MLILNLYLGNTEMKCALAVLIRMVWNGFKMLDLVVEPKTNLGQVQSNFVILLLVSVVFLFAVKHLNSRLLRCLKIFNVLREFLKTHTQVGFVFQ